jgi:hypothetical protein
MAENHCPGPGFLEVTMPAIDKPVIRMAVRIHRRLCRPRSVAAGDWGAAVNVMLDQFHSLENYWRQANKASARGWYAANRLKAEQLLAELPYVQAAVTRLLNDPRPLLGAHSPLLGNIIADLLQLKEEFGEFTINLKEGMIVAQTETIVLEGIDLGRFAIELKLIRLEGQLSSDCFEIVAVDPNPATSNSSTIHPHVSDARLCAGDATLPISAALKEGRIADAFILIRSVLQTYNRESAYVSLANWSGLTCAECGYVVDDDQSHFCEGCEHDVCDDCYSYCDICDSGCCRSCLETDTVSDKRCCPACRRTCKTCSRTVDETSFDEESELCPQCLSKLKQEESENEPEPQAQFGEPAAATTTATAVATARTGVDLLTPGLAQAPAVSARRRNRSRRVRHQQ